MVKESGSGRSPAGWDAPRRRSPGSCVATRPPEAASSSTARQSCSGRRSWIARRPKPRSSRPTSGCELTCRSGSGQVRRPDGAAVAGSPTAPWRGRNKPRRQDRRWASARSPGQISARLRIDFPDDASMRISHEAIYQALYVQGRGALRRELTHVCGPAGLRVPQSSNAWSWQELRDRADHDQRACRRG